MRRRFKKVDTFQVYMNSDDENNDKNIINNDNRTGILLEERPKVKKPPLYKVIMLNDDYTPMEFVVEMLQTYFAKSAEEATQVMLNIHQKGLYCCK